MFTSKLVCPTELSEMKGKKGKERFFVKFAKLLKRVLGQMYNAVGTDLLQKKTMQ